MAQRYCTNCGAELREEDRFCGDCGRPVHETARVSTPEADVPVPPPPRQDEVTAAAVFPQNQSEKPTEWWQTPIGKGIGVIVAIVTVLVILANLPSTGGSGGGGGSGKVAEKPQQKPAEQEQEAQVREVEPKEEQAKQESEPAPEPQPEPAPRPITLTESGPEATRPFQLESGLTVIEMKHQGNANFIVDLLDENGNSVAPMGVANVIGPFQGSTPVQIKRGGQYLLDVQNAGNWQIVVRQPRVGSAPKLTSFSGNSAQATQLFELSGGLHRVEMTHQGNANFIVDLLDENGASVVPMGLVNDIGPFEGSKAMTVPDDGIYLFWVEANGPWTIKID